MNDFRADLHCHTSCSDGSENPAAIIQIAKQAGLSGLSITDHDTVKAYEQAIPLAKEAGITLIPGVEFSATQDNHSVHILGYGFQIDHEAIQQLCEKHKVRRKNRNLALLERLEKKGMPLTYQEVIEAIPAKTPLKECSIGRPHIALAMLKKGYVQNIQEAFGKYIGDHCPCYVQGTTFSVDETIDTIHHAKGIAVIAHPHLIKNTSLLNLLLTKSFDGIECYYGNFMVSVHQHWIKIAKHRSWVITGGSDFHGTVKPTLKLGQSWIGKEDFQIFIERIQEKNK
jgi:predicted metal-dependent phosphoesterase TrpH